MVSLVLQNFSTRRSSTGIQFWNCLGSWMLGCSSHSQRHRVYYSVKQFISFWTDLIPRQLSLIQDYYLLPMLLFTYLSQFYSLVPHEVDTFLSNEGLPNISIFLSGFHKYSTFLFETKQPHFSNIPFSGQGFGLSPCWSSWLRWSCKHEAPRPGHRI